MSLPPPPLDFTRQVGVSSYGSPIVLSRSSSSMSDRSDARTMDQVLKARLESYLTYLQHEIDFINNEIQALIHREPGPNEAQEQDLLRLREQLKVRFNHLQVKKERTVALIEVL